MTLAKKRERPSVVYAAYTSLQNLTLLTLDNFKVAKAFLPFMMICLTNCTLGPNAHKEENDPGSHSLCIGSLADKEGKVEKAEVSGIGGLGGKTKLKIL